MAAQRTSSWLLTLVLLAACVGVYLGVQHATTERIARNERAWFQAQLDALLPAALHDNDVLSDTRTVIAPEALGSKEPLTVYRARQNGTPTALVMTSIASEGYGGPITLLVGIDYQGTVLGVRVLAHHETPNMGNDFELPGSHWLADFVGHSLTNPEPKKWNVRKDGGEFDQFASATITPRAIVHAVQQTLDYYQQHRDELFR